MRTVLMGIGIAVLVWLASIAALMLAGRRVAARQLARLLPDLATLVRGLVRDPRVPRGSKVLLWLALAWVVSPIDLIPEFLPIVGPLDDVVVVALVLRHVLRRAGSEVLADHWKGEPATLAFLVRLSS